MGMGYYDRDGTPIGVETWGEKFSNSDYKRIGWTEISREGQVEYRVSTVWLGIDHRFEEGPPLIFETMVFPADGYSELETQRYTTEAEAFAGHRATVARWLDEYPERDAVAVDVHA